MRRRTLLQTSSLGAMLIVGIAVMLNLFAHFAHFRLDFSAGKIYSMSPASKRVLRSLPDPVVVKLFYSKALPPQVAVNRDYARDLLSEYRSASGGKVRVQLVTETGPETKEEAQREGVAIVRFDVIESDRREQRDGFLGISIQYREKKEVLPFLQEVTGLEYDLTSRIKTMTAPAKPILAFITSRRATGPEALEPGVKARLESRFELKSLDLASVSDDGIPPDIQTALYLGPHEKLSERELWLLDQYLASGRSLGVAVDTKRVDMRNFFATDNETGLPELLAKHGVKPLSTIVLDRLSQPIQLSMQQGFLTFVNTVEYPPFIIARDLSKEHIITKDLEGLVVPFASPLEVTVSGKRKAEVLLRTTRQSWAKPDKTTPIMLHPLQLAPRQPGDLAGPFPLAVAVEGEFAPTIAAPPKNVKAKAPLAAAAKPGRLAVVGTSRIMAGEFRVPAANYVFMLNLMDWLALDADLIAIRSKTVGFRPLRDIPDSSKALVKYSLIFLPSIAVVGLGLLQWRRRAAARARRVAEFGTPPPAPPAPPAAPEPPPEPAETAPAPEA